jgi:hypothetical protein
MGLIYAGVPTKLVLLLNKEFNIRYFIETGTYLGETAFWASQHFEHVITIEKSSYYWGLAQKKYSNIKNVQFLLGDSREVLQEFLPRLASPTVYWLDAHWSGGETYGQFDECALLDELEIINKTPAENFILIDDARLFLSPPNRPYSANQWPDLSTIIQIINPNFNKRYVVVIEDVIVAVPQNAREFVIQYCQDINTHFWIEQQKIQNRFMRTFPIRMRHLGHRLVGFSRKLLKD